MILSSKKTKSALYFILLMATLAGQGYCQKIEPSTSCDIGTSSDYDKLGQPITNGIIYCTDYKTGIQWKSDIDLLAGGLWRSADNLTFDYAHGRLFIGASKKTGGPGFRIFDLNTLQLITPETPIRILEGAWSELRVVGEYLVLFHYDSTYYDTTESQDMVSIYVFEANSLKQVHFETKIGGRMGDPIFTDDNNNYFYVAEKWNDREFPTIKKYSVPDLKIVDSLMTKSMAGDSIELVTIKDIKGNYVLGSMLTHWGRKESGPSSGYFAIIDISQKKVLALSYKIEFKHLTIAKMSGDGTRFFIQPGEVDSILVFNSLTGQLIGSIHDVWERALDIGSYIDGNELYISRKSDSAYKVINANTATEIRIIPITRQY